MTQSLLYIVRQGGLTRFPPDRPHDKSFGYVFGNGLGIFSTFLSIFVCNPIVMSMRSFSIRGSLNQ